MSKKNREVNKLPLVKVVWEDVLEDSSWVSTSEVQDLLSPDNKCLVTSYGLLYRKTPHFILLISSFVSQIDLYGSLLKIPRRFVISIDVIRDNVLEP